MAGEGPGSFRAGDEERPAGSDPLELFFDLVFVFAFTRITAVVSHDPTWGGVLRAVALLAALWWAWVTFTWLMDTTPAESLLFERVGILGATAVMFVVALAVPNAFGRSAELFGAAYFSMRLLHVALTLATTDAGTESRFFDLVPGFLGGPALILAAGFADARPQAVLWVAGIAIDYGVLYVRGVAKFDLDAEHFVERYRDVVIIALGESVLAMGFGVVDDEPVLLADVVLAALLGIVLLAALAWLYFDYVTLAAEERFVDAEGYDLGVLARDSYAYLHLPIVAGILFVAFGLEETVTHAAVPLEPIAAASLYGGTALYLLGHNAFRFQEVGSVNVSRLATAGVAVGLLPAARRVSALVALAALAVLVVGLVVFETVFSPIRHAVRDR